MPYAQAGKTITDSAQILPGIILNSDINAAAAIVDTKLAQIATAGKVSGAALTSLTAIPAGAGAIPAANLTNAGFQYSGTVVVNAVSPTASTWTSLDLSAYVGAARRVCMLKITSAGNPNYDYWVIKTRTGSDTSTGNLWGYAQFATPNVPMPFGASDVALNGRNNANGAYALVMTDATGKIDWGAYHSLAITIELLGFF